jgi:hypothetical protein
MEWGKLFKSSSAEKEKQRKNSSSDVAASKNPLAASNADYHERSSAELPLSKPQSRSAVSSPVLSHPPRTLTQIVQLTKEVEVRGSAVANATAAVIDRSLVEVHLL